MTNKEDKRMGILLIITTIFYASFMLLVFANTVTVNEEITAIPIVEKTTTTKLQYITDKDYTLMDPQFYNTYSVKVRSQSGTEVEFTGENYGYLNLGDTVRVKINHHLIGESIYELD